MKEKWEIPAIDNRTICVCDIDALELCASISSCFAREGRYFPVFVFPNVNTMAEDEHDSQSDGYLSQMIGAETAVLINNALARMTGCDQIIYLGLSQFQKSYLNEFEFSKHANVIEIDTQAGIRDKISSFASVPTQELRCKKADILEGIFLAAQQEKFLVTDENAPVLQVDKKKKEGLIVIEKELEGRIFSIIGVNYAISLGADIHVVEGIEGKGRSIEERLQRWESEKKHNQLEKVLRKIRTRVQDVNFEDYKYATFFTNGLPYSLGIENRIPCTHVHLSLRPDLFVCNSIGTESGGRYHSAVVFSPRFFQKDEETDMVIDTLVARNYYVRPLVGKYATSHNLDFHAEHFPYDLLHICSHGGKMDGYEVVEKFKDREGVEHEVEYYEAVSFAPVPGRDLIGVAHKVFFKKFNGFKWMSPQLKAKNFPDHVYKDMQKALFGKDGPNKNAKRTKVEKIPTSCSIQCVDDFHQGSFRSLASHHSPVIFNNSCLSWGEISRFFITGGARGYVGTLWSVSNYAAVKAAKTFYSMISEHTIMTSLHKALMEIKDTDSKDIYLYWGLHFTSLVSSGVSLKQSRKNVFTKLVQSFMAYTRKAQETRSEEVKKNSMRVAQDILQELQNNFGGEDFEDLEKGFERFQSAQKEQKRGEKEDEEKIQDNPSMRQEFLRKSEK